MTLRNSRTLGTALASAILLAGCETGGGLAGGGDPVGVVIENIDSAMCITHDGLETGDPISARTCVSDSVLQCEPTRPGEPDDCELGPIDIDETVVWIDINSTSDGPRQYRSADAVCLGGSAGGDLRITLPALARDCDSNALAEWFAPDIDIRTGETRLRNRQTGGCLTITDATTPFTRGVEVAPCDDTDSRQRWRIFRRS
ncbi:MAG: RICIN domain-containing protein [Pseudomonadota bacterium]